MAGIVFGCIVPHPPLMVPQIGRGQERRISNTLQAMDKLAVLLQKYHPDTALLVSPHGKGHHSAMGVLKAQEYEGNLVSWGVSDISYSFKNDLDFIKALEDECTQKNIPLKSIGEKYYELDHGSMAPLYYLVNSLKDISLVPLTFSWLPRELHYSFGQAIQQAAINSGKNIVFIASGDLSHRLIPSAPAGYDPMGKEFDRQLAEAISRYDVKAILNLDEAMTERAGECGLRSIIILLGIMDSLKVKPAVMSYEGPFGVGYLVASFEVEMPGNKKETIDDKPPLVCLARETVESYVRSGKILRVKKLTEEMKGRAGTFVSIKKGGELRGCIGTFEPTRPNIAEEVITNAISSATRDPRFFPVTEDELPHLEYSVDILTKPEPVDDIKDLDPKRYGVIVESHGRKGLLLPDLEGVDTVEKQIEICRYKAGISPKDPVKLYRFEVKRYK